MSNKKNSIDGFLNPQYIAIIVLFYTINYYYLLVYLIYKLKFIIVDIGFDPNHSSKHVLKVSKAFLFFLQLKTEGSVESDDSPKLSPGLPVCASELLHRV